MLSFFDITLVFRWLLHIVSPIKTINSIITLDIEATSVLIFKDYWAFPIFLATLINIAILTAAKMPIYNPYFVTILLISSVCSSFLSALMLFILLKINDANFQLANVIAIFSISVIYLPIISLFSANYTYSLYSTIYDISHKNLDQYNSFIYIKIIFYNC